MAHLLNLPDHLLRVILAYAVPADVPSALGGSGAYRSLSWIPAHLLRVCRTLKPIAESVIFKTLNLTIDDGTHDLPHPILLNLSLSSHIMKRQLPLIGHAVRQIDFAFFELYHYNQLPSAIATIRNSCLQLKRYSLRLYPTSSFDSLNWQDLLAFPSQPAIFLSFFEVFRSHCPLRTVKPFATIKNLQSLAIRTTTQVPPQDISSMLYLTRFGALRHLTLDPFPIEYFGVLDAFMRASATSTDILPSMLESLRLGRFVGNLAPATTLSPPAGSWHLPLKTLGIHLPKSPDSTAFHLAREALAACRVVDALEVSMELPDPSEASTFWGALPGALARRRADDMHAPLRRVVLPFNGAPFGRRVEDWALRNSRISYLLEELVSCEPIYKAVHLHIYLCFVAATGIHCDSGFSVQPSDFHVDFPAGSNDEFTSEWEAAGTVVDSLIRTTGLTQLVCSGLDVATVVRAERSDFISRDDGRAIESLLLDELRVPLTCGGFPRVEWRGGTWSEFGERLVFGGPVTEWRSEGHDHCQRLAMRWEEEKGWRSYRGGPWPWCGR
ncbi:hypothetical protein DFJ73DRAFT_423674 [Zopfochytrium polystomum]|nr:hypothetical protein DFJ73DRAFT_423674 [Zopfochytrium polystomum]